MAKGRAIKGLAILAILVTVFGCAPKKIQIYQHAPAPEVREHIVEYAVGFMGRPYRNGAKGPDSFDCSGFVYYVFRRFDIAVPISTDGLNRIGYEISRSDVIVGDLVVFRIKGEHHVGIMMNRTEFIHASKSRGVTIDSIDAIYWRRNFYHFRRVF